MPRRRPILRRRGRASDVALAGLTAGLALVLATLRPAPAGPHPALARGRQLVAALGLSDLVWTTETRYLRHLSQADRFAPFQDHPGALERAASGALVGPPSRGLPWRRAGVPRIEVRAVRAWLERQRGLADYTLASLGRRKGRNVGLVLAFAVVVFAVASVMLLGSVLRRHAAAVLADSPEVMLQTMVMGRHDLTPDAAVAQADAIRGVRKAEGRLWGYFFDSFTQATFTLRVPPAGSPLAVEPGKVRIGAGVARAKAVRPGDGLVLFHPAGDVLASTVLEVLPGDTELVSADLVLVHEQDFRSFFGLPEGVWTDVALTVRNASEVDKVLEKLVAAMPRARVLARRDLLRTYQVAFDWREGFLLTPLLAALLAFGLLAWDKASGLSAEETREIGILKAIGWDTGDVLKMKAWEGLLVAGAAFVLGYLAAWVHVFHLGAGALAPVLAGWSILTPRLALAPHVDASQVLSLLFLTVLPYVAATVVPVWRAATIDPDTVMR